MAGLVFSALAGIAPVSADQPDPDRYIVSFLDVDKGKSALRAAGARIELDLAGREAVAAHIPPRALKGLARNPNIEYIEPDALRYPMAQTTPWGIPAVQADMVPDLTAADIKVCIIDSGYDNTHEDLRILTPDEAGVEDDPLSDTCYHGTHVAGTIAALTNDYGVEGVLPGGTVGLHIVKVFDGANCAWSYSSSLVAALDECVAAQANIVSMSLGGGVKSRTEQRAFAAAENAGVLSIAAAGNDGNTRNSYPASYDSVISVAAVDSALQVADFSQQNDQVELSAPGVAVRSTVAMGAGLEESLEVANSVFEAVGMEGSFRGSVSGALFECAGLGYAGDCEGATGGVCLIQRGDITFAEKVQECEDQGGVGAVIYNNAPALFSGTLGGVATSIPSVAVSGDDGAGLVALAGSVARLTVASGNYAFYDGTSMATPHVSGVAALVWSTNASCTNSEIRSALNGSAIDLGPAGRDNAYGFGLVQADDATALLDCGGAEPPPGPGGTCELLPQGASCSSDSECCSSSCKGKPGSKTCR